MKTRKTATNTHSAGIDAGDKSAFRLGGRVFAGVSLGLLLVVGVGGWGATAPLTGAVIAHGSIKVDQNLKAVQHRDGGIVSEIAVKEGDFVAKDQIILRLDDVQTRAELSIVRAHLAELNARKARLLAERDGLDKITSAVEGGFVISEADLVLFGELRLFNGNRQNRESQISQLRSEILQLGQEVTGLEAQKHAKSDEIAFVEADFVRLKGLVDHQLIEQSRIKILERDRARLLGERGEIDAQIARAKARVAGVELQIIAIDENARTEAQRELSAASGRIAELKERRAAMEDLLSRTEIRAPLAGTINELSIHTIGGVIKPAETLVTIVPENASLKIEVRLSPNDIDQIHVGQPAKLRFSSFNQRTTPELKASVSYVSPATSTDPATGQPFYVGDLKIEAGELQKLGTKKLLPGMPVEAFVSTEERTALSYLSKPVVDQFNRAFREQ